MYIEIVAVSFENEQKHINEMHGQKFILLSVETSRMYINCQGLQRQLSYTIILSKMKLSVKLSINTLISNLIKSVSIYLHITSILAKGHDGFGGRFALNSLKFVIFPKFLLVSPTFLPLLK